MDAVNKLLDKARETCSLRSDMALAAELRVTRSAVSNWRNGRAYPDEVACARLAKLTGEPLARVLGVVGEARAISKEAKAVWRSLASAAALVLLVGAAVSPALSAAKMTGLYIMSSARRTLRNVLSRDGQHTLPAPCMATIGGSI